LIIFHAKFNPALSYAASQDRRLIKMMDKAHNNNLAVYKWIVIILSAAALIQLILSFI